MCQGLCWARGMHSTEKEMRLSSLLDSKKKKGGGIEKKVGRREVKTIR